MDERKDFFESSASTWDDLMGHRNDGKLVDLVREFGVRPGDSILDVGTGTGVLLPMLGSAAGEGGRLAAIDFSFKMLAAAVSRGFSIHPSFFNAVVTAIPLNKALSTK